uniref:Uncharacterized protein n=1 Tax=Amphimedon queenslandica TaxID=400682 RepID=A0A1X7VEH4_AMPQE
MASPVLLPTGLILKTTPPLQTETKTGIKNEELHLLIIYGMILSPDKNKAMSL